MNYLIIVSISDVHLFGHLSLSVPYHCSNLIANFRSNPLSPVLAASYLHIVFKFLAVNVNVNRAEFLVKKSGKFLVVVFLALRYVWFERVWPYIFRCPAISGIHSCPWLFWLRSTPFHSDTSQKVWLFLCLWQIFPGIGKFHFPFSFSPTLLCLT